MVPFIVRAIALVLLAAPETCSEWNAAIHSKDGRDDLFGHFLLRPNKTKHAIYYPGAPLRG